MADTRSPFPAAPVVAVSGPTTVVAGIIAAGCIYQVGVEAANRAVGYDMLPTFTDLLGRTSLRQIAKGRPPQWMRTGTAMGVGLVAGVMGRSRRR